MSVRLKLFAALNIVGWLVAVPLLVAALLGSIVGFGSWPDALRPGGSDTVKLAQAPARAGRDAPAAPSQAPAAEPAPLTAVPAPAPASLPAAVAARDTT